MASTGDVAKAPITGVTSVPAPQSITATVASTAEQALTGTTTGVDTFEFVAAGLAHVAFGKTGMGAATTADRLITQTPVRFKIAAGLITHIRAIRNGAADVVVSFQKVD